MNYPAYTVRRLAQGLLVLCGVMIAIFVVFQVLGDPVRRILPADTPKDVMDQYSAANGYDDPLIVQFGRYAGNLIQLDFGQSLTYKVPSMPLVLDALTRTLSLAAVAFVLAILCSLPIATLAALKAGTWIDRWIMVMATWFMSIADFWIGVVFVLIFAVQLGLLPSGGYGDPANYILPAMTLALVPTGRLILIFRARLVAAVNESHVSFARELGLSRVTIIRRHIVGNSSLPMIAASFIELSQMITGGAVTVELIYSWPGMGRLYLAGMERYDISLVSACLFVATVIVLGLNIFADLIYARIDPRVTLR